MAKKSEPPAGGGAGADEREVRIYSLATTANECIVFLEEVNGKRLLPIWIGLPEGQAIAIRFSGIVLPRPLTHDLLLSSLKTLGYGVERITITDLKENTFYAQIHVKKDSDEHLLDSRPSDAIAVAVRAGCSMYVKERVFERCQVLNKPISEDEVKNFKEELKNIRPEDIFKDLPKKPGSKKEEKGGPPSGPKGEDDE
ncbi:MAG TPA: bifunctional nuclease family protein [Elusimicrobiota bacterium]|jgi:bifunctional DNase/RNase|nr:bifunctional nuclease family protein [Elusimicrobiota bacterium]